MIFLTSLPVMATAGVALIGTAAFTLTQSAPPPRAPQKPTAPQNPTAPFNLAARIAAAQDGAVIQLPAGDYGKVIVKDVSFPRGIKIDARAARFSGIVLESVRGISIDGGTVIGPGGRSYGVSVRFSRNVNLNGMNISGAHRGVVIGASNGVTLTNTTLTRLVSDGINIANARNVVIRGNTCREFTGEPGAHPDCIQGWSRPNPEGPTADVLVENNVMSGKMQGIFFGNHTRNGVNDGGFDRITVRNNTATVAYTNGIGVFDARNSSVTGNTARRMPGATLKNPTRPVKVLVRMAGGYGNRFCGNSSPDVPKNPGQQKCK